MRRGPVHRLTILTLSTACVLGACTGGSDPGDADTSATVEPAAATSDADAAAVTTSPGPTTVPAATTSTTGAAATTTEPPPRVVPLGQRWELGQTLHSTPGADVERHSMVEVAGAAWYLSTRYNGVVLSRSDDGGATWRATTVPPPTSGESMWINDMVEGADGRLVALATRGVRCADGIDAGDGYQFVGFCTRQAAAVLLSDDGGATWRRVDPPAMAPPGNSSVRPVSIIATASGFVAAGTVAGPDWHARLWSSPDGENWVLDREVRGSSPYVSAEQLLTDGTNMVLLVADHPCAEPRESTPGWVLGADWVRWPRVFSGTSTTDLTLLTPAEHPFVRDLDISNCDVLGSLESISAVDVSHPGMSGTLVGGSITLLEDPRETDADIAADEADDDEAALNSGVRRLSQFVDGQWTLIEIDGVQTAKETSTSITRRSQLIDVDGEPALVEVRRSGVAATTPVVIVPGPEGWEQRVAESAVLADTIAAAGYFDGSLVVATNVAADPWADAGFANDPEAITIWTTRETAGDRAPCVLAPGVVCMFADLTRSPGYPDFAGLDLTGADLAYADFGASDLTGANLSGARLWGATSDDGFSADGADFTGALVQAAILRSSVGADFTMANLAWSTHYDASGATFTGAQLSRASITMDLASFPTLAGHPLAQARITLAAPADGPFELSLAGVDLSDADVGGGFDGPVLKILSLDGAVLDDASLRRVDLTAIDPTVIDLSTVDVWDELSVCPDGRSPDGLPIGTCVRAP